MKDEYFDSEEFKSLLRDYEAAEQHGRSLYLEAEDFCDVADYYLHAGKPQRAVEVIDRGLSIHADDDGLLVVKSSAFMYMHRFKEAEALLDRCEDKEASDILYQRAQLQYALYGNVEKAEEMFRDWIDLERENNRWEPDEYKREDMYRDSYVHVISSFLELCEKHRYDGELVRRWVEDYIVTFSPLGNYDSDLLVADLMREEGILDMVVKVYNELLATDPYIKHGYTVLCSAQYACGEYENAIESAEFALAINPDDEDALITKAHSLYSLERKAEAVEYFLTYIDKTGDKSQCLPLAFCYIADDKDDEAREMLQQAEIFYSSLEDSLEVVCQALGDVAEGYLALNQPKDTLRCIMPVIKEFPDMPDSYLLRGTAMMMLGKVKDGLDDFLYYVESSENNIEASALVVSRMLMCEQYPLALSLITAMEQYAEDENVNVDILLPYKALAQFNCSEVKDYLDTLKLACEKTPELTGSLMGSMFPPTVRPEHYYDYLMSIIGEELQGRDSDITRS